MRRLAALVLLLGGCRFGGENGDALALVEPRRDAGLDAETMDDGDFGDGDGDSEDDEASDASWIPPADAAAQDADDDADAPEECQPVVLPGCDPVHNQGCTDGITQCVIDPESLTPAGRCVFSGVPSMPCSESALTTTCQPMYGCVEGSCQRYCSCDTDCDEGETCGDPQGDRATGEVRVCEPASS